jgi:hypothetical protein
MLSSEGWQRRIYKKNHQKQLRKKKRYRYLFSLVPFHIFPYIALAEIPPRGRGNYFPEKK